MKATNRGREATEHPGNLLKQLVSARSATEGEDTENDPSRPHQGHQHLTARLLL